jgi:hypothetical protein
MKKSDPAVYKREQRAKYLGRLMNPDFSPEFRDEIARNGTDADELRKPVDGKSKIKVIVSNHIVEVWEYDFGVKVGGHPIDPNAPKKEKIFDPETGEIISDYDPLVAKRSNARRAKNEGRRLIISNFDNTSKFITLTFRDGSVSDVKDVRECNREFTLFIKRLRKRFGDFKYFKVIEFQDANGRGAVHYHFISTLPFIHYDTLGKIWGHGFIGVNRIEHVDNIGAYVTSYMLKDFEDTRLSGEKAYSTSQNLTRPIVLYGSEAAEIIEVYLENKKEVFTNSYESEYQGQITYKEFNLQREGENK